MKQKIFLFLIMIWSTLSFGQTDLIITGVYDAGLTGGTPKGVELYVVNNIADLSLYAIGSATNGGGSDGAEYQFPNDAVVAGSFIYVSSEATQFNAFFGFDPNYTTSAMGINGDDAVELFFDATGAFSGLEAVIDLYGDINTIGDGEVWDYTDGWAYRNSGTGPNPTFTSTDWTYSGINVFDGQTTNATSPTPLPIGTYTAGAPTNDQTSTVTIGADIPAATISSLETDSTVIMQFTITDAGGDGLPTIVTGMIFVAGPNNTLNFNESLAGGTIYNITDANTNLITGPPSADATSVSLPVTITIAEGTTETFEVATYIDNLNVIDHGILQFKINSVSHGFTTNATGSGFEDPFVGGDIIGNDFTIDVLATQLSFIQQPTNVVKDVTMSPAVEVAATDLGGNVDIDQNSNVTLTFLGTGTMSGTNPVMSVAGVASYNDLSFDTEETGVTIRANVGPSPEVTSIPFNVTGASEGTLFISEYIEGTSSNKAIEIYNPTSSAINLQNYRVAYANNGGDWSRWHVLPNTDLNSEDVWVLAADAADALVLAQADEQFSYPSVVHYNGNDAIALEITTDGGTSWTIIDIIGDPVVDPGTGWDVAGTTNGTAEHTIVRKYPSVTTGNTDWASSAGTDVATSEWVVNNQDDFSFIGWHGTPPDMPPVISNIGITPTTPSPSDIVTVAATITDDNLVTEANVYWSLISPVTTADNSLAMAEGASDVFETTTGIPAQTAATTVYYMIAAYDASKALVTSPEQEYTVSSPSGGADCANAVTITPGTQHAIHTQTGDGYNSDQYYVYNATMDGTMTVSNCGLTSVDDCEGFVFDTEEGNCDTQTSLTINIQTGHDYYVAWGTYDSPGAEYDWTLSVSDVTPVNSIALLRAGTVGNKYELTNEAVITFQQSYRGQKYIQDATAAILIDDWDGSSSIITTAYNQYDGITGLIGTLGEYNGMLQFIPSADPGAATSTGNTVTPQVITLAQFNTDFEDYEAELVTISDITFADAGSAFVNGTVYSVSDASSKATANFRTNFYNIDYIDATIPENANVTALCIENSSGITFTARNSADIDVIIGLNTINENAISIYPNPSNGTFTINVNDNFNIEVLDIAGKVLQNTTVNSNTTINISEAGVYFLRFTNEKGTTVKRIIVK